MLTFQRGSTLILRSANSSREFLISSASVSQTFLESSREVRTIHTPEVLPEVFTTAKSNTSISFDIYVGNVLDGIIFEWAGFVRSGNRFTLQGSSNVAIPYTVELKSNGTTYRINNVYLDTLSVQMSKQQPLTLSVSAVGENLTVGITAPAATTIQLPNFFYGNISSQNTLAGLTCEITRSLNWVDQSSVHAALSGQIYTKSIAVCSSLNIAGAITQYKRTNEQLQYNNNELVEFIYADKLKAHFSKCTTFTRYDMSEIHRHIKDYKVQSGSLTYFEFI